MRRTFTGQKVQNFWAFIEQTWLFLVFIRWIPPKKESQWTVVVQKFSKINSKTSLLILFYIKIFPTPTFMEQVFFRNCHFLPHFFLKILDVLTISWTFYIVTSIKFLQIWNFQDISFHLTPSLHSLTKIENWPKIWKWNAQAIKYKCAWGQPELLRTKISKNCPVLLFILWCYLVYLVLLLSLFW